MKKNPYFIDGNGGLSKEQLANMKLNNFYLYKALNQILKSVRTNDAKIGGPLRASLLTGELKKSDALTGVDTNRLGEKLKFLVIELSDKNHPEKLEAFKKSYLYNTVIEPLSSGYILDEDRKWSNYKHTSNYEQAFKNKNALDAALTCQREDEKAPLGLDFSKIIDSFVKTDEKGNFYLEDSYTIEEEIAMGEAVNEQLKTFKNNSRFKANYSNPKAASSENEFEDEDELG